MKINLNKTLKIGNNQRTLIIAEISANHCGSKKNLINHILKAKEYGADLVKIQTYEPEDMIVDKNFKIKKGLWKGKNLWNLYKKAHTPFDWHYDAFKVAKKHGIELFSTPFSLRALKFLNNFKPNIYKISSFELTDHRLVTEIAKKKKPIILSTGLSSISEINAALKIIRKYHNKIILLYCVSGYPTPLEDINFQNIEKIKTDTKVQLIGFSDHTKGIDASIASLSYRVKLIEKHFTIKRNTSSPDSSFSITPDELKNLKAMTIKMDKIYNSKKKNPVSEDSSKIFRRSIYAIKHIKKNEKFSEKNIACFRPKFGIGAENYFNLLGKKSKKNIKQFSPIRKKMI